MAGEGGLNVGRIFASLGFSSVDDDEIAKWRRERDRVEQEARKKVEQHLGFKVDDGDLGRFKREASKLRAETRRDIVQDVRVNYDERGAKRAEASLEQLGGAFRKLFEQSAKITVVGLGAQAMSAAGGAAVALTSALAPLSGALAAYPALGSAAAQGMGVIKLATAGVGEAVGGLNEKLDTSSDAFKKLTPEAQGFVRQLDAMKPLVVGLQRDTQREMFGGLTKGLSLAAQNTDVLRRRMPETAKVIGDLATQAGRLLGSRGFGRDLETQMRRNDTTIRRTGEGALHLGNAVRNVTLAAGPLVEWMTRMGVRFTEVIDKQAEAGRESGKLAHFFDETRIAMSRVARIGADLATAFFNIGRAGKPLGDDILVSLVKSADAFRRWTDSARGRNAIAEWFREARPAIFELGRLIRDVGLAFGRLGRGSQVAPLLRTVRTEILPIIERVVDSTTKAFGPPFLHLVAEAAKAFEPLVGTTGPLTQAVILLGKVFEAVNKVTEKVPAIGTAIASLATVASLYAALRITATLTGLTRIIGLLRTVRGVAATTGAVSAVAGGAGGAAGGAAAARSGVAGSAAAFAKDIATRFPAAAIATAIAAALAKPLRDTIRGASPTGDFGSGKIASVATSIQRFNAQLERLDSIGDKKGADKLARQFDKLVDASGKFRGSARDVNRLTSAAKDLADEGGTMERTLNRTLDRAGAHFRDFRRTGSNNLEGIRRATSDNMHFIRRTLGNDSAEGREALAKNFRLARSAIRQAMRDGTVSVREGLREIQRLMRAELKQYGITGGVASSIIKHGDIKGPPETGGGGAQRGGTAEQIKRGLRGFVGGGWIGNRGMVGDDVVPAVLAPGEAVLNRHQQAIIEGLLGDGFLDELFARVRRPHFMASGGFAGAVAAASQLDRAHFPYLWGGGHQSSPARFGPMDCSGAVSYVLQHAGINIPTMVSGQLASAGRPGTGPLTVFANPVHTFMRIGNRYFGTSGQNPGGGAGWFNDPGAGYKSRFSVRAFLPGEGGALGEFATIRAPQVAGGGYLRAIAQGALNAAARGANARVNKLVGSMGLGTGDPGDAGPVSGNARSIIAAGLRLAGLPATGGNISTEMSLLSKENRSGDPTATNPTAVGSEHATGFLQTLPSTFRAYAVPGHTNIHNPVDNAAASFRYQMARYGRLISFSPYARGGFVQRFAAGGKAKTDKLPKVVGKATAGLIRKIRPMQLDRSQEFEAHNAKAEQYDQDYARWERRYNLTEEELVDADTGQLDMRAIHAKAMELQHLIAIRMDMEEEYKEARDVAKRIIASYRHIIRSLRNSLKHAKKKKERAGIRTYIKTYTARVGEWQGHVREAENSLFDVRTDLKEIKGEQREILATKPTPADTGAGGDLGAGDIGGADLGGADIGGGGGDLGGAADAGAAPEPEPVAERPLLTGIQAAAAAGLERDAALAALTPETTDDEAARSALRGFWTQVLAYLQATGGSDELITQAAQTLKGFMPDVPAVAAAVDLNADLTAFRAGQADLLRSFAGNALTPGQAFGGGGPFSGAPGFGAQMAGVRGFGGSGALAGTLGAGSGGPVILIGEGASFAQFASAPPSAPSFVQQTRFIVEGGAG